MQLFLTIALVNWLALITPGPDFFFVSQTAISRSRREALAGVAGIATGVAFWAALALLGLQLVLQRLAWLQQVLMIAGGAYLCWLGAQMLRAALQRAAGDAPRRSLGASGVWQSARRGLLTNLANPKAVVYFASVFSGFLGHSVSTGQRWGLWLLVVSEAFAWFVLVATCFALPSMRQAYQRAQRWIDGVAGGIFVLFGLHLLITRRAT